MIDFLAGELGRTGKHDVAGLELRQAAGVGAGALCLDVLGLNSLGKDAGKFFRVAAEAHSQGVEIEDWLEMSHQLDTERKALRGRFPSAPIVFARRIAGLPERQEVAANGRTARCRGFSELLPARRPGRPEGTINAGREVRGQIDLPKRFRLHGDLDGLPVTAQPIEPARHGISLVSIIGH